MKKNILLVILTLTFLLSACGGNPVLPTPTVVPVMDSSTSTPSPLPTTASVTPLPTIPAFTPTFDARTIVTVTPASPAECPIITSTIRVEDYLAEKLDYPSPDAVAKMLDFLNAGGDPNSLISRLQKIYPDGGKYRGGYGFYDVTGDHVSEFLAVQINFSGKPVVFSCQKGRYELLATLAESTDSLEYTFLTDDLNNDGIPEIIIMGTSGASFPVSTIYFYEWNGQTFSVLGQGTIASLKQIEIKDNDGNGTKEISFLGDKQECISCSNFIPQRQRTITYDWNGKNFVETSNQFASPEYRFQAIQDADMAVSRGDYDKALVLYDQVISNTNLGWWSPDKFNYEQTIHDLGAMSVATPSVTPTVDTTEYPKLAAYAYYRIMLLHTVRGYESDASTVYNTLQQNFDADPNGRPYAEMASAFWDAYQSTHKMYDGCAAAIHYADEHPEILIPLGSDYHGSQSHTYVAADVCPFR